jgi:hypothetical protein
MKDPTRMIRKCIDNLGKRDLKAKWAAVFDTYLWGAGTMETSKRR